MSSQHSTGGANNPALGRLQTDDDLDYVPGQYENGMLTIAHVRIGDEEFTTFLEHGRLVTYKTASWKDVDE